MEVDVLGIGLSLEGGRGFIVQSLVFCLGPLLSRCSCISLNTRMNLLHDIYFMGRIRILLRLYSYKTNIYLLPMFEVTGNLPVRSVDICLLCLMIFVKSVVVLCVSGVIDSSSCLIGSCCLVELILFLVWLMWPLAVAIDGGRCL